MELYDKSGSSSIDTDDNGPQELESHDLDAPDQGRRRLATVYDAVAGRVFADQPLREATTEGGKSSTKRTRTTKYPTRQLPMAADEVLFRRRDAPPRYEEDDLYNAHERDLPQGGRHVLPDSDLLKAIHSYSSQYYGSLTRRQPQLRGRNVDERSMDETALLAFGILLQEAGRGVLGRRGDLVFTEGAESQRRSQAADAAREDISPSDDSQQPEWTSATSRAPKRRKTVQDGEEA